LTVDYDANDKPILLGVRPSGKKVGIDGMSDGALDQLYLSLRLASIDYHIEKGGDPMPFIVDDILSILTMTVQRKP
jgi:uncharacterized protein YhaN